MELRYHTCGHPVQVRDLTRHRNTAPTVFDGSTAWNERPITPCPRWGDPLTLDALHEQPRGPAAALATWLATWPEFRHQIEALLSAPVHWDPHCYAYDGEMAIDEFAAALRHLADVTAQLEAQAAATG